MSLRVKRPDQTEPANTKEIYDVLERIKEKFLFDDFQEIAPLFDPLKTIGKYQ